MKAVLKQIVAEDGDRNSIEQNMLPRKLAVDCYREKRARTKAAEMLADFGLDENCVEAEARRRASAELDLIERQLTSLQVRRDKTLTGLADYRDVLSERLKQKVQRISEADDDFEAIMPSEPDEPGDFSRLS